MSEFDEAVDTSLMRACDLVSKKDKSSTFSKIISAFKLSPSYLQAIREYRHHRQEVLKAVGSERPAHIRLHAIIFYAGVLMGRAQMRGVWELEKQKASRTEVAALK